MNVLKKKTGENPVPGSSNAVTPSINPAVKRKREVESFQRTLIQRNHPPILLDKSKGPSVTVPDKISKVSHRLINSTEEGIENLQIKKITSDPSQSIKESVQKFAQNYKKNTTSKDLQVGDPNKTRVTKDSIFDKKAKPILNVKKLPTVSSLQKSIDESLLEIAQFERKQEPLLTDLSNLLEELEDKTNPLLKQTEERINDIKTSVTRLSQEHRDKMKSLTERIKYLREERVALAAKLEDKRRINFDCSAEKEKRNQEIKRINQSIFESKLHLEDLQKKSSDLNQYINTIEVKINNTRGSVREKCQLHTKEQLNVMNLQETIHQKQNSTRSLILIRQNQIPSESNNFFKFSIHDCSKRLKLELTVNGFKYIERNRIIIRTPEKYYVHDGLFYVDNHQQSFDELFQNQDENTYRNILNSILQSDDQNNFFFNIVSNDSYRLTVLKTFLKIILTEKSEGESTLPKILLMKFNSKGEIFEKKLLEYFDSLVAETELLIEDSYEFITFAVKLTESNKKKRFNFILGNPENIKIIETVNSICQYSKDAFEEELNIIEETNMYSLLKLLAPNCATYNILSLPSKGSELKYAEQFNELIAVLKNAK